MAVWLVTLCVLCAFIGICVLWYRSVVDRGRWPMYRVRVASDGDPRVALDAPLRSLLERVHGEIWTFRLDPISLAIVITVPPYAEHELRVLIAPYATTVYLTPVTAMQMPRFVSLHGLDSAHDWPLTTSTTAGCMVYRQTGRYHMIGVRHARGIRIPRAWLPYLLIVLRWLPGGGERPTRVLPDTALGGYVLPPIPPMDDRMPDPGPGSWLIGPGRDGTPISVALTDQQQILIRGGATQRWNATLRLLLTALRGNAGGVAWLAGASVDALLRELDPAERARLRVVDWRSVGSSATLDLHTLTPATVSRVVQQWARCVAVDPLTGILDHAIADWCTGTEQVGWLFGRVLSPSYDLLHAAGFSRDQRMVVRQRWQHRLAPLIESPLLHVLAAPGTDAAPLVAAGGWLVVVQPADPMARTWMRQLVDAVVHDLPVGPRPCVVVSDSRDDDPALAVHQHAGLWSGTLPPVRGWQVFVGGSATRLVRPHQSPLNVLGLTHRWIIAHPAQPYQHDIVWDHGAAGAVAEPDTPMGHGAAALERGRVDDGAALDAAGLTAIETILEGVARGQQVGDTAVVLAAELMLPVVRGAASPPDTRPANHGHEVHVRVVNGDDQTPQRLLQHSDGGVEAQWVDAAPTVGVLAVRVTFPRGVARHPSVLALVGDRTWAFPWLAINHLAVVGDHSGHVIRSIIGSFVSMTDPDRFSVWLIDPAPIMLAEFCAAPHSVVSDRAGWDGVNHLLDRLLRGEDSRTPLVVIPIPDPLTNEAVMWISRLLQRAHSQRVHVLVVAAQMSAALLPFDRYLSFVVADATDGGTLVWQHWDGDLPSHVRFPPFDVARITDLPARVDAQIERVSNVDPATFWDVDPADLRPSTLVDSASPIAAAPRTPAHGPEDLNRDPDSIRPVIDTDTDDDPTTGVTAETVHALLHDAWNHPRKILTATTTYPYFAYLAKPQRWALVHQVAALVPDALVYHQSSGYMLAPPYRDDADALWAYVRHQLADQEVAV